MRKTTSLARIWVHLYIWKSSETRVEDCVGGKCYKVLVSRWDPRKESCKRNRQGIQASSLKLADPLDIHITKWSALIDHLLPMSCPWNTTRLVLGCWLSLPPPCNKCFKRNADIADHIKLWQKIELSGTSFTNASRIVMVKNLIMPTPPACEHVHSV